MARIPPIAQAQILRAPGVDAYAMREGPNIAGAFTAGLAAGSRIKEAKTAEKNREADKADRDKSTRQSFEMEFGQDIVTNPQTGEVDIPASRGAQEKRKQQEAFAGSAGESYAGGISMDGLTPEIMESPAFKAGLARGMAKIQQEEAMLGRITKREEEAQKRQEAIEAQRRRGMMIQEGIRQAGGVLKGLFGGRGGGRTASEDTVTITEGGGDTGLPRVQRRMSPEEFDAYQKRQKEAAAAAAMEQQDAPIIEALRKYDELKSLGKDADIETDAAGNPIIEESSFWETATPEVIEALRRRVRGRGKTNAPVPLGALLP
jgi:hypothetical protein